jgi:hypothetical protein
MMTGQHRAGEIVEAARTGFAPVALAVRLCVVAPIANNRTVAAAKAANAICWGGRPDGIKCANIGSVKLP